MGKKGEVVKGGDAGKQLEARLLGEVVQHDLV